MLGIYEASNFGSNQSEGSIAKHYVETDRQDTGGGESENKLIWERLHGWTQAPKHQKLLDTVV